MKKAKKDEMRTEYRRKELGKGVRGKFYREFQRGSNVVLLRPEVAAVFRTEQAVNDALMALLDVARRTIKSSRRVVRP